MSTDIRWNYLTIEFKPSLMGGLKADAVQAELARQGAQGWELVNIISVAAGYPALMVFKKAA